MLLNTSWSSGEESNQHNRQDLLAEETLSVTLNHINSRSEVRAGSNLTLWKKTKSQQKNKTWTNLENFVLREGLVDKRGLATLCLSGRRMFIKWYLCSSYWDRVIPKWFCPHNQRRFKLQIIPTFQCS